MLIVYDNFWFTYFVFDFDALVEVFREGFSRDEAVYVFVDVDVVVFKDDFVLVDDY